MRFLKTIKLLFLFLVFSNASIAQENIPRNSGYVNDFAKVLNPDEAATLNQILKDYSDSTSTEIAIAIESNLNGNDVMSRSLDIARAWQIGQKDKNNGVLLYIAIEDKKIFIQTADQTQGVLTDYLSKLIIEKSILPEFKKGNYYAGIYNGVVSIQEALRGEFKADTKKSKKNQSKFLVFLLILLVIFIIISRNNNGGGGINRRGAYPLGGGLWGGMMGGGMWGGGGGGSSGGGSWGGFGGGGGFNGGGAGGSW